MTSTAFLKQLLGHIDRTSIQTDPVYLLVAIPRDKAEEGWRIVMAEEIKKIGETKMNVPEKHKAIAHAWVDGAKVEGRNLKGTCTTPEEWMFCVYPAWYKNWEYRIKPTKLTKPSINWEHVAPEYVALAMDENGRCVLYKSMPTVREGDCVWHAADLVHRYADTFASLEKGTCDWKDSLVLRPSTSEGIAMSDKMLEVWEGKP